MSFESIKGHDKEIAFLKSSIENGRVAHAYIFHGPSGIGKRTTALQFAKALNCLTNTERLACDECIPCRKIASGNHPDIFILGAEDAGGSIKIDDIRSVIKNIALKPYEARKKVYIIDGADTMTEEASHALLKTLEEPISDSVIILVTARLNVLLPTILSRSQTVKFSALTADSAGQVLRDAYAVDGVRSRILASLTSGRVGEALRLNTDAFFSMRSSMIKGMSSGGVSGALRERVTKEDLSSYLAIMLTVYRDVLVAAAGAMDAVSIVNIDSIDDISAIAAKTSIDRLHEMIRYIVSIGVNVDQNANPRLALAVLDGKVKSMIEN